MHINCQYIMNASKMYTQAGCSTLLTLLYYVDRRKMANFSSDEFHRYLHLEFGREMGMTSAVGVRSLQAVEEYNNVKNIFLYTFVRHPFER